MMKSRRIGQWILVAALVAPVAGRAQGAAPPGRTTLDALLAEVRLLRQAIERQRVTAARTDLLMGRISLQERRVTRARESLDRLENELAKAEGARRQMQNAVRETTRALEEGPDPVRRADLERDLRSARELLAEHQRVETAARARHSQADQALQAEAARYDELESWLRDLDRELQRAGQ
jgi:hypothetical protein